MVTVNVMRVLRECGGNVNAGVGDGCVCGCGECGA